MPYRNQLAPPSSNRLGDEVPSLDPMLMPPPYVPPQSLSGRLENLSIGLGRGKAQGLEGLYQMVTQPRATAQAIAQFAREVSDDPGVVLEMLRQARQKAMSGSLGLGELIGENVNVSNMLRRPKPVMQEITAHHGSPYRFDKFELSDRTIGTGEGAQAYGHGLYFAENPEVAKRYIYGRGSANDLLAHPEASPGALAHVRSAYMESDFDSPKQITKGWLLSVAENADDVTAKELSKIDPRKFSLEKGNLYTVDIPDEQIAKMLDWDKPLSEQPASVRKAIKALEPLAEDSDKGSDIYALIRSGLGGNHSEAQAATSARLRQAGIPGMRFLDKGSRTAGKGTRNLVVFDDSILKILSRE